MNNNTYLNDIDSKVLVFYINKKFNHQICRSSLGESYIKWSMSEKYFIIYIYYLCVQLFNYKYY